MPPELGDDILDDATLLEDVPDEETEGLEGAEEGYGDEGEGTGADDEEGLGGNADHQAPGQERHERSGRVEGRSNARVTSAVARAQAAERLAADNQARADALQRQIAEIQQRPDPITIARQQQEEAERVSLMAPHEVARYYADKATAALHQQQAVFQRQQLDAMDQIAFRGTVASNPLAKRFETRVEQIVGEQRGQGFTIKRDHALRYAIGEAMMDKASKAAKPQKAAGAARVASNTVRRNTPPGDVGNDGGERGSMAALEKRLAGRNI